MKTLHHFLWLLLLAGLILTLADANVPLYAGDEFIPGETREEYELNSQILESVDEAEVLSYLTHMWNSTRLSACMRLYDIGTTYSLSGLTSAATQDADLYVREQASVSLWNIKYKGELSGGRNGSQTLLSILVNDGDKSKTRTVIEWGIGLLGDMAYSQAISTLSNIVLYGIDPPYSDRIKTMANSAIVEINFINSLPLNQAIQQGLTHTELCIRIWAVKKLAQSIPPDIADKLNALYSDAIQKEDLYFASCISQLLDEINKKGGQNIEFIYPKDGDTVKAPTVGVYGTAFGETFNETISLNPGLNVYTKTVTKDGVTKYKSIRIYFVNAAPVLQPVGSKSVTAGSPLAFTLMATDADDTELMYFICNKPSWANFDNTSRAFSGTPKMINIGSYNVTFEVDDGYELTDSETITITVTGGPNPAPTNLRAMIVSAAGVWLSWTDNCTYETGFRVCRSMDPDGIFEVVKALGPNVTNYLDTAIAGTTTYYYKVCAYNADGNTVYSNLARITTPQMPPYAPGGLEASVVSSGQINLAWADNSSDETGFKIERKTGSAGTWAQIGTTGSDAASYSDALNLNPNTAYYYRVRAYNAVGNSPYSNESNATTLNAPPVVPSGLEASPVSTSQINLTWKDNSANETGFKIERKTGSAGTWAQIGTVNSNALSYNDIAGLSPGTLYYYRVRAYNGIGNSSYSNEAQATTQAVSLHAPSNLIVTFISANQINLAWADNSTNEAGFKIERAASSAGPFTEVFTTAANVTSYNDSTVQPGTSYYYRVRAYSGSIHSAYSNITYATTPAQPTTPGAPSNLQAAARSARQIILSWRDNSTNELYFRIERSTSATFTSPMIFTPLANNISYTDTIGLLPNTTYYYRICACNTAGNSGYSNTVTVITPAQ